jgi:hypothetical protein
MMSTDSGASETIRIISYLTGPFIPLAKKEHGTHAEYIVFSCFFGFQSNAISGNLVPYTSIHFVTA